MMPRLLSFVLRQLVRAAALLLVIAIAAGWPARGALVVEWPARMEEVLTESGLGRIERHFVPAGTELNSGAARVLARNRSRSIWQIEMQNGQTVFGWLSGVVDAQGQVETDIPRLLRQARIDSLPALQLVVVCSDEAETIIDAQQVSRMLQPNALTAGMRLRLWRDRLFERWRWPLIHRADGQMTPPRQ
ncbi:MAG TPA: hypothetical protein VK036_07135 [Wenzhouxiangella sp.]|nr:hypothetical protein [Wenzhouxiangella sp.]